jgi:hypothetical protein
MFDSIHAANSRTGIRTWLLPSLVHKPRKEAENASCCCEAGSLAISKAWPMVIWSFRNASATGGTRSASRTRPYYVAFPVMCLAVCACPANVRKCIRSRNISEDEGQQRGAGFECHEDRRSLHLQHLRWRKRQRGA